MQTLVSRLSSHTPTTQQELDFEIQRCVEGLRNGSVDMAEFMRQRKVLTDFFETVKTKLGSRLPTVFSRQYGSTKYSAHGVGYEVRRNGYRYDYASSGHPYWPILVSQEKTIVGRRKVLETQLRQLNEPICVFHPSTGELVMVNPPSHKVYHALVVKLPG